MKHHTPPTDDPFETDAVWELLDQATPRTAGPRFAGDVVRAARLAGQARPWWRRLAVPAIATGLAAATAAVIAMVSLKPAGSGNAAGSVAAKESFADLQEAAETETLSAAADHLDDFSDSELVCLIGL